MQARAQGMSSRARDLLELREVIAFCMQAEQRALTDTQSTPRLIEAPLCQGRIREIFRTGGLTGPARFCRAGRARLVNGRPSPLAVAIHEHAILDAQQPAADVVEPLDGLDLPIRAQADVLDQIFRVLSLAREPKRSLVERVEMWPDERCECLFFVCHDNPVRGP